jgi:outer membrane lipoprotein-sorting protein
MKNAFRLLPRLLFLGAAVTLTGCYKHTRIVEQTRAPDVVMNSTVEQLVKQLNTNFDAIQTLNASVTLTASTGGGRAGKVTEYTAFKGYILMRKPRDLRVILQVPVFGGVGLDMVSDGKDFKLIIPHENKAMIGLDQAVTSPSKNPLYDLRPFIFFDAFFIPSVNDQQFVTLTQSDRIVNSDAHKHLAIQEPDYDLAVLHRAPAPNPESILEALRVVHYSRITLLPYQQDIYDEKGRIVTSILYSGYKRYGDINFPTQIDIRRPYDELELKVVITKLTLNKPLDNDQFELKIPAGMTIQKMD